MLLQKRLSPQYMHKHSANRPAQAIHSAIQVPAWKDLFQWVESQFYIRQWDWESQQSPTESEEYTLAYTILWLEP